MGFSLKKLLEGAAAQVNMNDGGKTFATVVRNQPVQSQPAKTPPPSYGSNPVKQAINRTRDVFDANTPQDRFKRQLAQKPVIDFTAQDRARQTVNGVKNVAGNYAKGFVESYNQVGTGLGTLLAQNSADVKNAQKAQNNLADQLHQQRMTAIKTAKNPNLNDVQRNRLNNYYNSLDRADVDLQNSRTQQSNDLYSKLDPKKNLAAIGSVGFDIATLGVGTGGTQAVKQAFKSGIKTGAKELGGQMLKTGSLGAVSGGLSPIVQKGDQATAKDILQGAGMGFAMGAALPAVAPAVKFGGSKAVNTIKGLTKENLGAISPRLKLNNQIGAIGRNVNDSVDPLEALKQEARKYKSAEEFVKAHGEPVFHGTKSDFTEFDNAKMGSQTDSGMYGKGFYFTPNIKSAQHYAGKNGKVKEVYLDMKNPYVINTPEDIPDIKVPNKTLDDLRNGPENYSKAFTKYLKDKGYDGVIDNLGVEVNQRVVFDASQIKTKQQLTDLYNQALKESQPKAMSVDPLESLKQEARKYKSAEEFVKAQINAYHGTDAKFDTFDNNFRGTVTQAQSARNATFFTDNPDVAKAYATYAAENRPVIALQNEADRLEKIAQRTNNKEDWLKYDAVVAKMEEVGNYDNTFNRRSLANVKNARVNGNFLEVDAKGKSPQELSADGNIDSWLQQQIDKAKAQGKDGVKFTNLDDGIGLYDVPSTHYAVFDNSRVMTDKQLTDLYNQAHQSAPVEKTAKQLQVQQTPFGPIKASSQTTKVNQKIQLDQPQLEKGKIPTQTKSSVDQLQQSPANQPSSQTSASSLPNNTPKKGDPLDRKAYQRVFNVDEKQAAIDLDAQGNPIKPAVTTEHSKNMRKLLDTMNEDSKFTRARKEAQKSGKEFNFYARTDESGRSVGIEMFNPKNHRIEAGFVVDDKGRMLGNHIKVDDTGTQINIGGKLTNMNDVMGDVGKWGDNYKVSETLERNIMSNAPDEKTGKATYEWLIYHKNKSEATMKTAAKAAIDTNTARQKEVMSVKPFGVKKKDYLSDAMAYGENRMTYGQLASKYNTQTANVIKKNIDAMRKDYDAYLDKINEVRIRFGKEQIPKRKDYITHINEMNNNKGFVGEVTDNLRNGIMGEGMQKTRAGVPADIAGRTENFKPITKWNPFLQHRNGGEFTADPFKAFEAYVVPAEHNIHMTESVARARAVEEFFRANKALSSMNKENYGKLLSEELAQKVSSGKDGKLVTAFQEYANALAGKTQRWDRQIIDASKASDMGLRGWQWTQRVAGRATIPGNIKSVLMQPLNQLNVMSQVKPSSYMKGIAHWLSNDKAIEKSPFITARKTYIDSAYKGYFDKFADKAGVPMQKVELESVKLAWAAQYQDVLKKGLKGQKAIAEADRLTERVVAGRGLADKPELYRSTATNGILQYTLEVMAQSKVFWKDLTPTQKAKWIAGAYAINTGIAFLSNDRPLPDYINAAVQSYGDFTDSEDKRSGVEKSIGTAQRFGTETIKFNPVLSMGAKFLPDDIKRNLFGSDSELTRYDGSFAPMRVFSNTKEAVQSAAQGNWITARNKMLKNVPAGNQMEKTLTGAEMLIRGYDINDKEERTFDAPTGTIDKARALVFGPNASDSAQSYYDKKKSKANQTKTVKTDIQSAPREDQLKDAKNSIKYGAGKEWQNLSEEDIKNKAIAGDQTAAGIYKSLQTMEKVYGAKNIPTPGLSTAAEDVLNQSKKITKEGESAWGSRPTENKGAQKAISQLAGEELQVDNATAEKWAKYERDRVTGKINELDKVKAQRDILKSAYSSTLSADEKKYFSYNDTDLINALQNGSLKPDSLAKAMSVDSQLVAKGLITTSGFGKKVWNALGLAYPSVKGSSTRTSGRRTSGRRVSSKKLKTTKTISLDTFKKYKTRRSSTNASLRKLLGSAKV